MTPCLEMRNLQKEVNCNEVDSFNFFEKMSRSALEISAFGDMLLHTLFCGRSKMVMLQLPKLATPVRFRSPAPFFLPFFQAFFPFDSLRKEQEPPMKTGAETGFVSQTPGFRSILPHKIISFPCPRRRCGSRYSPPYARWHCSALYWN